MDKVDQITLDYLVNRTSYKKYVKQHQQHNEELQIFSEQEQCILYKNIEKHRKTINAYIQKLLDKPQKHAKIQEYFESFIEVLFQEEEIENESSIIEKNDVEMIQDDFDRNAEDEDDTLFENIPEHEPTEIEYWKMQKVFKMSPSTK